MLNEEQKKQIRQIAEDGAGYRETMKCVLALKQDIIDYRNELVETGWTIFRQRYQGDYSILRAEWFGAGKDFHRPADRKEF